MARGTGKNFWPLCTLTLTALTHSTYLGLDISMNSRTTKPITRGEKLSRFIPERLGTPEDVYDDPEQEGSLQSTPSPEIPSSTTTTTTDEIKFDIPPNPSPKYLFNLATRLYSRHTFLHSILQQATITAQEAAASVFIMQARLDGERKKMGRMMDSLVDLVGNWKEQESDDDDDGAQGDEGEEERREDSLSEHGTVENYMSDLESNGPNLDKGKAKETNTTQALPVRVIPYVFLTFGVPVLTLNLLASYPRSNSIPLLVAVLGSPSHSAQSRKQLPISRSRSI